jgi:hypothetical protein
MLSVQIWEQRESALEEMISIAVYFKSNPWDNYSQEHQGKFNRWIQLYRNLEQITSVNNAPSQ